jgi:hypothetical protein
MTDSSNSIPTIGVNPFVRRQTAESEFTHFDDGSKDPAEAQDWAKVVALVEAHFAEAGGSYHQAGGVVLVPVPPQGFHTGVVQLKEGDKLVGAYEARRKGEEPRKTQRVTRPARRYPGPGAIERGTHPDDWWPNPDAGKRPCVAVDVVLYKRETLEGEGEECTGADWDIISVNGRITEEAQPIHPDTLIANHFELDGGTATGMTPEQFESALRESVLYWRDKAMLAP